MLTGASARDGNRVDAKSKHDDPDPFLEYLGSLTEQLATISKDHKHVILAHLLDMVAEEVRLMLGRRPLRLQKGR